MALEFENLDFEQMVLALMLKRDARKQLASNLSLLAAESFSDDASRRLFGVLRDYKGKETPAAKLVSSRATFNLEPTHLAGVESLVEKIYARSEGLGPAEAEAFPLYCEELRRLEKVRRAWSRLDSATRSFERGDIDAVKREMQMAAREFETGEITVFRTNPVEDFGHHRRIIKQKIKDPGRFAGIPTGIGLYDASTGGLFPKELIIMLACAKVGKSTFLLEVGHNVAMQGKFNLLITIEMDRYKAANRFFSRRSGIPFAHFRDPLGQDPGNPAMSEENFRRLKRRLARLAERGGIYEIVEFKGRACTVAAIEAEVRRAEEKYERRVDVVTIDYLNDMAPAERNRNDDEWQALGTISWDMSQLAKSYVHFDEAPDRPSGLAIVTANQAKTESAGRKALTQKDFAYSPRPREHANAVCYLTKTRENEEEGTLNFGWVVARDFGSEKYGLLFPDFRVCRLDSPKMKKRILGEHKMGGTF